MQRSTLAPHARVVSEIIWRAFRMQNDLKVLWIHKSREELIGKRSIDCRIWLTGAANLFLAISCVCVCIQMNAGGH